jgi:hypothetical protein
VDVVVTPEFVATTLVSSVQFGEVPERSVTEYGAVPPHHDTVIEDCPEKTSEGEHSELYCCVVKVPLAVPTVVYGIVV